MPLKVRRYFTSISLVLIATAGLISAQTPQATATQPPIPSVEKQPTSAEIMRERISKAKAFIAVRNYNAAIYELENIRRETSDTSVNSVTNVLLMNTYLEQGDYKRAQIFLNEFFKSYKSNSAQGNLYYAAVAGQVIKGSRSQVERYRALGLNVSDRNLPLEAVNDIERMRETLELVVEQAKELSVDKIKSGTGLALLEEATNSRVMIARDDYDARRWRDALQDSRESLASSRSVIINAVDGTAVSQPPVTTPQVAVTNTQAQPIVANPGPVAVANQNQTPKVETQLAVNRPVVETPKEPTEVPRPRVAENKPVVEAAKQEPVKTEPAGPLDVGSLVGYATKQQTPIYPPAARSMRATGMVKVEVTVNETGEVVAVQKVTGPMLLQNAARDAVRNWKFRPILRDGQPVQALGFINFNFAL